MPFIVPRKYVALFILRAAPHSRQLQKERAVARTHILGFPRIGAQRELKFALESFWRGDIDATHLEETGLRGRLQLLRSRA
jgi:hypothetical protein